MQCSTRADAFIVLDNAHPHVSMYDRSVLRIVWRVEMQSSNKVAQPGESLLGFVLALSLLDGLPVARLLL